MIPPEEKKKSSDAKAIEKIGHEQKRPKIYFDPELQNLPDSYGRDIVKILYKNPLSVFVFWEVSEQTLTKVVNSLGSSIGQCHMKLFVKYLNESKHKAEKTIELPPFTNNWYLKFDAPVKNLKIEVAVFSADGRFVILLHSAEISLPHNKPSMEVDSDWISEKWVSEGWVDNSSGQVKLINWGDMVIHPMGSSEHHA